MDWKTLFLNANGRIGQKDFWVAWVILLVATLISRIIPVLGIVLGIILIYPTVCIYSKRLHDFGKSGWLTVIPYTVFSAALVIGAVTGGAAMMASIGAPGSAAAGAAAVGGFGVVILLMLVAGIIAIGFLLWVGLSKGDSMPNRYGPPPASAFGGPGTTSTTPSAL